jgi:hypothetical protein
MLFCACEIRNSDPCRLIKFAQVDQPKADGALSGCDQSTKSKARYELKKMDLKT